MVLTDQEMKSLRASLENRVEHLANRFNAISDPSRLFMLFWLMYYKQVEGNDQYNLNVSDLVGHFRLEQPTISHHLALLRQSGLVSRKKWGLENFYCVRKQEVEHLFFDTLRLLGDLHLKAPSSPNFGTIEVSSDISKLAEKIRSELDDYSLKTLIEVLIDLSID